VKNSYPLSSLGRLICKVSILWSLFTPVISLADQVLAGRLHVVSSCAKHIDDATGFFIETPNAGEIRLLAFEQADSSELKAGETHLPGIASRGFKHGEKIKVWGKFVSTDQFFVSRFESMQSDLYSTANAPASTSVPIVLILKFGNDTSKAREIATYMMNKTAEVFPEVSYGLHQFNNDGNGDGELDIVGPIEMNRAASCEDYKNIASQAINKARNNFNVDFSKYNHRVMLITEDLDCGGRGNNYCSKELGSDCRSWIYYINDRNGNQRVNDIAEVYYHELGHNLGLHHASDDNPEKRGKNPEYGDASDTMGYGGWVFFNAANTEKLNWFDKIANAVYIPSIKLHSIKMYPLALAAQKGGLRALKYQDGSYDYYLNYRTRINADEDLTSGGKHVDRITIYRMSSRTGPQRTNVMDILDNGDKWVSPNGKLTVKVKENANSAYKELQLEYADGQDMLPIVITEQPKSMALEPGELAVLQVQATGVSLYQWYKDGEKLLGKTSSQLSIPDFKANNVGSYSVEMSSGPQSLMSDTAELSLGSQNPLKIITNPHDRIASEGSDINLTVYATGTGSIKYQWEKNGTAIEGATANGLSLRNLSKTDSGDYRVKVSDSSTSLYSARANVLVEEVGKWKVISITLKTSAYTVAAGTNHALVLSSLAQPEEQVCKLNGPDMEQRCEFDVSRADNMNSILTLK